ncbi:Ig-like domain-containing protein, partial [Methanosphaera sp.]|uniref:Ig-like domain-containing protein n=1 Tax=Methanosphaera sp. TaxID=2666342 RepID=UPI002E7631E6
MNKYVKGCLLFLFLSVLTLGVVSASTVSNDSVDMVDNPFVEQDNQIGSTNIPDNDNSRYYQTHNNLIKVQKNSQKTEDNSSFNENETSNVPKTIIFNSETFDQYVSNRLLNENVTEGDTLDFQGKIFGQRFALTINKPVNIISSTNDALYGNEREIGFTINQGGSGTNLTNVHFYNTHVVTKNASYVNINNITVEVQHCLVGSGQGVTSIRDFSNHVNVTNSLFYSNSSIGVSTLVCAGAQDILIENNTVRAEGYCGNVLYFTTYNLDQYASNRNITLKNNLIDHSRAQAQNICIPLVLQGSNHKIINNTLLYNATRPMANAGDFSVMAQMVMDDEGEMVYDDDDLSGNMFINNSIEGPASLSNAIIYGNKFETVIVRNSQVYNNSIQNVIVKENSILSDNEVITIDIDRNNSTVLNNDYVNLSINESTNPVVENNTQWVLIDKSNIDDFAEIIDLDCIVDYSKLLDDSNILFDLNGSEFNNLFINNLHNKNLKFKLSSLDGIVINNSDVNIFKSDLSQTLLSINNSNIVVNDSLLLEYYSNNSQLELLNSNLISGDNTFIVSKRNNNFNPNEYEDYFDMNTNILLESVPNDSNLLFVNFNNSFTQPMIINKAINISGINNTVLNCDIYFVDGSEGSNLTNLIINGTIYMDSSNINTVNNKIYGNIVINNSEDSLIRDNLIIYENVPITLVNTNYTTIINNNITTNNVYTILLDNNSKENIITNNYLIANNGFSRNTVNANLNYNNVINNYPKQNVNISIQLNDTVILNKPALIVVNVTCNNELVDNGLVVIYSNGIKKAEVPINNGKVETPIYLGETGQNTIWVDYISEDIYSDGNAKKNVTVNAISNNIDLTVSDTRLYENTTFTVTIMDEYGDAVNEGNVTFSIYNSSYIVPVKDGVAVLTMVIPEEYVSQTMYINFSGTESIKNSSIKYIINMKGESIVLLTYDISDNTTTITAIAKNIIGKELNNGYIQFVGPNLIKLVKIENNKAILTIATPTQETAITATFRNNPSYEQSSSAITIVPKKDVLITYEVTGSVSLGANVTITGKFTDVDGKIISNSNVKIMLNGVKYYAKTDSAGMYCFSNQTSVSGINNVSIGYSGNNKYNPYEVNTTFLVGKQDVFVTYNPIVEVPAGTNVSISGTFTTNLGKAVSNSNVRLFVNGVKYLAKTDKNGVYNASILVTAVGVNNLTVGYAGNDKYNSYEINTTFNVGKQNVIVTYDPVMEVPAGTNVTITGTFTTNLGKAISNSNVRVFVNGVKYLAKTDKNGKYNLSVLVTKVGVNNLSVGYSGNAKYNPYEVNSTFNVGKQNVIVTYDPVKEVPAGTNVTITGKFTDNLGKAIVNSNVKIFVNGVKYYVKTDSTGKYSLSVLVTKVGTNNLSVGYSGNTNYNAYETTATFNVKAADAVVTYEPISDV